MTISLGRPSIRHLRDERVQLGRDAVEEVVDPDTEDAEADGQADDEEADDHGVLGRALALLALEPRSELSDLERNPLEHSLPPFELAGRSDPALLDTFHLGGRLVPIRTAKGWVGPPLRISFALAREATIQACPTTWTSRAPTAVSSAVRASPRRS